VSGYRAIALLGRRDEPTDAVEEYCRFLGDALQAHHYDLKIERVEWAERGWRRALRSLRRRARGWYRAWVLVQYTALAWSARGFPRRFLRILKIVKDAGAHVAVVYHDSEPYQGARAIDWLRRQAQLRVMREAIEVSDAAIFTLPPENLSWIKSLQGKAVFIPVGANLHASEASGSEKHGAKDGKLTIAVFGVTGGEPGRKEIESIAEAVRFADERIKKLRLVVFGRNSQGAEPELRMALRDTGVEVQVLGVLPETEVAQTLFSSDVLLFVRGPISTQRGSAIAGIACGLPVIASEGPQTTPPITQAGLALYSPRRQGDLGDALVRVLGDEHYRTSLAQRSWLAQAQYFSWSVIAARYAEFMKKKETTP
jgi:glycosyltransferase involved in cell wall biosynthesis